MSRRNFIELCERLTAQDEQAFEAMWRRLGLSVDWSLTYQTIDDRARRTSQRTFLRNLARGEAYLAEAPTLWDVTFRTAVAQAELEDREQPGAYHRLAFHGPDGPIARSRRPGRNCCPPAWRWSPTPTTSATQPLFGTDGARRPLFGVGVPVVAHRLADPGKGTGIAMVCTFGDTTDVTWWRELQLATRPVIGWDGRFLPEPPPGVESEAARAAYAQLVGATPVTAREKVVALLRQAGETARRAPADHAPGEVLREGRQARWRSSRPASGTSATAAGTRSCALSCIAARRPSWTGVRRTCGSGTTTGSTASTGTGWSAGSASSACRCRSGTRWTRRATRSTTQPLVPTRTSCRSIRRTDAPAGYAPEAARRAGRLHR